MIHLAYLTEALAAAERSHTHYIETIADATTLSGPAIPPAKGSEYATADAVLDVVTRLAAVESAQGDLDGIREALMRAAGNRRPDYLTKTHNAILRARDALDGVRERLFGTLASQTRAILIDELAHASSVVTCIEELQAGIKAAQGVYEQMTQRPDGQGFTLAVSYR